MQLGLSLDEVNLVASTLIENDDVGEYSDKGVSSKGAIGILIDVKTKVAFTSEKYIKLDQNKSTKKSLLKKIIIVIGIIAGLISIYEFF